MKQLLLFDDPRPLVERLGRQFFHDLPQCPGVYLMRDAADDVLYVGKARNLRKRLGSYRVANPERLRRRHLRLLHAVARIELQPCADEAAALARESQLLRALRPRFNRAGTWVGTPRFIIWNVTEHGLELALTTTVRPGWNFYGPLGPSALLLRTILLRLFWCALNPEQGYSRLPHGWFRGHTGEGVLLPFGTQNRTEFAAGVMCLSAALSGKPEQFLEWIHRHTAQLTHRFETAVIQIDLSTLASYLGVSPRENCLEKA